MGEEQEMPPMPQEMAGAQPQDMPPMQPQQEVQPQEQPASNMENNEVGTIQEFAKMCEDYEAKFGRNLIIDSIAIMESPNIQQLTQTNPEVVNVYNGLGKFFPLLQDIMNGMMEDEEPTPMQEEPKASSKIIDFDKIGG